MPRSKRPKPPAASVLLVAVLGLIATAFGPAGRAAAATDTITVASINSPNSDRGDLSVTIDSTTQLTALAVHLLDGSNTDVLDPAMTLGTPTATTSGFETVATVTTPIAIGSPPAGLPLGSYAITVDATDAGTSVTGVSAGTLNYVNQLTFTIGADRTVMDYDHRTATVSGTVTSLAPDGTTSAYASQTVKFEGPTPGASTNISTDLTGAYTMTIQPLDGESVAVAAADNSGATGQSTSVNFTIRKDPEKVTAALSAKTIIYGTKVTATGTVSYLPAGSSTYVLLPSRRVDVYDTQNPYSPSTSVITDSTGHFMVTLPNLNGNTTWSFQVGTLSDTYLNTAQVNVPMAVNLPVAVTNFKVSLNQFWQLSYSGCVTLTKSVPGNWGVRLGRLVIQHAPGPKGPWSKMNVGYQAGGGCGIQGWSFHAKGVPTPYNYSYYRGYFTGAKSDGGIDPGYTAAASKPVLAWKYADRITSFSVTPHVVAANGKITVKGQLQYYYVKWRNYAGQVIYIIFRQKGTSAWYWIVKVKTNSTGHFSATVRDVVGSATWSAQFNGNSTHLAASPPGIYVRVSG